MNGKGTREGASERGNVEHNSKAELHSMALEKVESRRNGRLKDKTPIVSDEGHGCRWIIPSRASRKKRQTRRLQ